jgi:hypothetical protein
MDVRSGIGWPNIHAARLVPFMKDATRLLLDIFPERLHLYLLYPVPLAFAWIWNIIKNAIDPRTDKLLEHMSEEAADRLEKE